jgi:hypothetical protein
MFKVGTYNNYPVVMLQEKADSFPFSFGLQKAKLVCKHFKEIQEFVTKQEKINKGKA